MRSPLFRFIVTFLVLLLGFSVLSVMTNLQNHLHAVEKAFAGSAAWVARHVGSTATVDDNLIWVNGLSLNINHECTGVFVLFVLASFITAYPARWRAKVAGILIGISLLSLINMIRIATLVRVVEFYPNLFTYFHEYVWQGAFLMMVTLYAITWVEWVRQ